MVGLFRHDQHGFFLDVEDMHGERIIALKAGTGVHLLTVLDKVAPLLHLLGMDQQYAMHIDRQINAAFAGKGRK